MKKIDFAKILVLISILSISINFILYNCLDEFVLYKNIIRFIALSLSILSIVINKKIKLSFKIIIIVAYLFLGTIIDSDLHINCLFLLLISYSIAINFNKNEIIKYLLIISIITLLVYVFLLLLGVITNTRIEYLGRIRNTLGFQHPNDFSIICYSIVSLFILTTKNNNKLKSLISLVFVLFIYNLTNSRSLLYTSLFFLFLVNVLNIKTIKKVIEKILNNTLITKLILLYFFVSPFIIAKLCVYIPKIDELLSFRGTLLNRYIIAQKSYSYIFGFSKINEIIVDNSFMLAFFSFGILVYFLLYKMIEKSIMMEDILTKIFIISMLLFGTMESILFRPECLVSIYFWSFIFFDNFYILNNNIMIQGSENYDK